MMRSKRKNRDPIRRAIDFVFSEQSEQIHRMLFGESKQEKKAREKADRAFELVHGERAKR